MYYCSGYSTTCLMIVQGLHICNQSDGHYKWNPDVHVHHTTVSSFGDFPSWVATVISLTSSDSESELPAEVPGFWNKRIYIYGMYSETPL
jgi:hypothetical protein